MTTASLQKPGIVSAVVTMSLRRCGIRVYGLGFIGFRPPFAGHIFILVSLADASSEPPPRHVLKWTQFQTSVKAAIECPPAVRKKWQFCVLCSPPGEIESDHHKTAYSIRPSVPAFHV